MLHTVTIFDTDLGFPFYCPFSTLHEGQKTRHCQLMHQNLIPGHQPSNASHDSKSGLIFWGGEEITHEHMKPPYIESVCCAIQNGIAEALRGYRILIPGPL